MNNLKYLVVACAVAISSLGCEEAKSESEMDDLMKQGNPVEQPDIDPPNQDGDSSSTLNYDVSENMYRFSFSDAPVFEDGLPAYGNTFITQGYVYPDGFLDEHTGTKADGSPAFPDEVLGIWTCRGYFVGDGAHTESGAMVITTQHWDLYEKPGYKPGKKSDFVLTNEGYESAEVDVPWHRPITGGTDEYAGAKGEAIQRFLGLNPSEGFDLRVEFKLVD